MRCSWIMRLVAGVMLVSVPSAWAWGPGGHEMVGVIASYYLTPTAREKVEILLGDKRLGDPEISCWPDEIRGSKEYETLYPQNRRWHYVDWDVALPYTNDFKLLPSEDGQDVVSQIRRWADQLATSDASAEQKLAALRFVVHFVGDLHQPLHCAFRFGDMGGNMLPVNSFAGEFYSFDAETPMDYPPSLHSVWDEALVNELMAGQKPKSFARKLRKEITSEQCRQWLKGDVVDWAVDSYWRARKQVYHFTDGSPVPFKWSRPGMDLTAENYIASHLPVVREQLQKAGVRLAHLLNGALDPEYPVAVK